MPTILVTTPTGHIGSRVVARLLDAGAAVRVFLRDPARLDRAVRDRVDARAGTREVLRPAFEAAAQPAHA